LQTANIKTTIAVSMESIHENKNLHVLENFMAVILAKAVNNDISILQLSIIFQYFSKD